MGIKSRKRRRDRKARPLARGDSTSEGTLDRLTKLAGVFGVVLPISAAIYGGGQLWLDFRKNEAEIRIKSLDVALKYTSLKADGKLDAANQRFLLDALLTMPIDDGFAALIEQELEEAEEILRLTGDLEKARQQSAKAAGELASARRETLRLQRVTKDAVERHSSEVVLLRSKEEAYKQRIEELDRLLRRAHRAEDEAAVATANAVSKSRFLEKLLASKTVPSESRDIKEKEPARPQIESVRVWGFRIDPFSRSWPGPPGNPAPLKDVLVGRNLVISGAEFGHKQGYVFFCNPACLAPLENIEWTPSKIVVRVDKSESVPDKFVGFIDGPPMKVDISVTTADSRYSETFSAYLAEF